MSRELPFLQRGLLQGKLPGMKEWSLYYVEVSNSQVHIYEGHEDMPSQSTGKHLRSLEISGSDMVGLDSKSKREIRFYLLRADGKYTFKCRSQAEREDWINKIQGVVSKAYATDFDDFQSNPLPGEEYLDDTNNSFAASLPDHPRYPPPSSSSAASASRPGRRGKSFNDKKSSVLATPLPPPPSQLLNGQSPRASIVSNDSGIGPSVEGEVRRTAPRSGASSVPNSGDSTFHRPSSAAGSGSKSDGGKFDIRDQLPVRVTNQVDDQSLEVYKWFWGCMSRQDCESRMKSEGKVGNFVVRINANGSYIMSFWRADGVHHHKIIQHGNIFRFERAAVSAEGVSLVDLLDTYMKDCVTDKSIRPFGGTLHVNYDEAWNPPDIDMNQLSQRLKEQKQRKEQERRAKHAKKAPHKRQEYTPVEVDIGSKPVVLQEELQSDTKPVTAGKNKPLPLLPASKPSKSPLIKRDTTQSMGELSGGNSRSPLVSTSSSIGDVSLERHSSNTDSEEGSPSPPHRKPAGVTQGWALPSVSKKSSGSDLVSSTKEPPPQTSAKPKKQPPPPVAKHRPKPVGKSGQQQQQQSAPPPPPDSPPPLDEPLYANLGDGPPNNKPRKPKSTAPKPITPKPSRSTASTTSTSKLTTTPPAAAAAAAIAAITTKTTVTAADDPEQLYQNWSSPKSSQKARYANIDPMSTAGSGAGKKTRKSPSVQTRQVARLQGGEQQPTGGGDVGYQNVGKPYMNQRK